MRPFRPKQYRKKTIKLHRAHAQPPSSIVFRYRDPTMTRKGPKQTPRRLSQVKILRIINKRPATCNPALQNTKIGCAHALTNFNPRPQTPLPTAFSSVCSIKRAPDNMCSDSKKYLLVEILGFLPKRAAWQTPKLKDFWGCRPTQLYPLYHWSHNYPFQLIKQEAKMLEEKSALTLKNNNIT